MTGFGPGGELLGEGGVPMTDNDVNPLTNANAAKMAGDLTGQKAQQAVNLQDAYGVEGTPALGIAGRFYLPGQGPRTLVVANALIAELRGDAGPMNAPAAASGELSPVAKAA